jgi:hypothetical protein
MKLQTNANFGLNVLFAAACRQVAEHCEARERQRRELISEHQAFCRHLADAIEIQSTLALHPPALQPSPALLENIRRYECCLEQQQLIAQGGSKTIAEFVRNELHLWRTKADTQRALLEAAEYALLTVNFSECPATEDPYRAIKKATQSGYRGRMPRSSCAVHSSGTQHAYSHGTIQSREILASVSLEEVCRYRALSKMETAVLKARFDGDCTSWPEAERLFGLAAGSLEPLRKRLAYHRDWFVRVLVLGPLLSYKSKMSKH